MGKIELFQITFDNSKELYTPGESITGAVTIKAGQKLLCKAVKVNCNGFCGITNKVNETTWTEEEQYFNNTVSVADKGTLKQGLHTFPFKFLIPESAPTSFEGNYGRIVYRIRAFVDTPRFSKDYSTAKEFYLLDPLNLNKISDIWGPCSSSVIQEFSYMLLKTGTVTLKAQIDKKGYTPGQIIQLSAVVHNKSEKRTSNIKASLEQRVTYQTKKTTHDVRVIAELEGGQVKAGKEIEWKEQIIVPPLPQSSLVGCDLIKIEYYVKKSAGKRTNLVLTDMDTSVSPEVTEICVKDEKRAVVISTKPHSAMKKKKRKMGLYNFVSKKKAKPLKHLKNYDAVQMSHFGEDEITKSGDTSSMRRESLTEAQSGEANNFEYTELNLDCLGLKSQEELILPYSTDLAEVTDLDLSEELPLCCCRMETPPCGGRLSEQDQTCMAVESIDGMLNHCQRHVMQREKMRPSNLVHLLVLCENHRASMVKHQCCPGCGLFCSVGTFMECQPHGNISHRFHRDCASVIKNRRFCPHCGEDASRAKEVTMPSFSLQWSNKEPSPTSPLPRPATQMLRAKKTCEPQKSRELNFSSVSAGRSSNISLERILMGLDDENLKSTKVNYPTGQLYISAEEGELQRVIHLLVDGKDPNCLMDNQNKRTPLHAAATEGHEEICHMLIQGGANLEMLDEAQRTPLMAACEDNHLETVKYLIRAGASINHKDVMGFTCLHLASKLGHYGIVQHLLTRSSKCINCQDDGGWTPITWAIEHKHKKVFYLLLENGADVNIRDKEQNVCLHWAALSGCARLTQALLDAHCDQNAANAHGDLPIHVAARENHLECVMDISRGYETVPVNCVNGIDNEPYPGNFKYIPDNCVTSPVNVSKDITHLRHCSCTDDCSSSTCTCGQLSLQSSYDSDGRLLLDFTQQDPPVLFECNHACSCWRTCKNRVVQNGLRVRLQLFKTEKMGWGVRLMQDVPRGTFICEYVGEIITDTEADTRENDSFLFTLNDKVDDIHCIDARLFGNIGRFINHLCEPNLLALKVFTMHQDLRFPRIAFFSSRTIKAGDQIGHLQVPGNHNLSGPEMDRPHRLCPEEGPAEAVLPETAQEVQPAARASEDLLHCHHPVCPLHLHHCLVWIGLQTKQAQTTTDNHDCRKDNWNQPPIYPRLVPVQDQETCKEHLYRPFSPRLQSV
ncbi:histone-lysine N-methyltransferase EHMT1a isoform X5 [Syngnathus typhle]|uniref:histone-lysine N-methyltransferase EHMT1a isoform X5 n=1 Tax=Syngnathus typhle TaxID=161592 RepID=UPI002A6B4761|nr:histone-lysine N-methyltransferase EHMT1a isoform X5 [Syngnathus typhle]